MSKFRNKTPVFRKHKEILIQPVIHENIKPVITKQIQPIINKKIQPVVHEEIQPIIHQNIQPIITQEIQPIIHKKIQPVIFLENQTNIEEVIQQLEQSNPKEKHTTKNVVSPSTQTEVKIMEQVIVQPYIRKLEKHTTKKKKIKKLKQ